MSRNLIVNLAKKCSISPPSASRSDTARFISNLYERICVPFLEETPILPDLAIEPKEHLSAIVESLSCDFLNLDLDPLVKIEDILAGDESSLVFLLRIFDGLYDCLVEPAADTDQRTSTTAVSEKERIEAKAARVQLPRSRVIGPTFKGVPILNTRSSSVMYSPRTAALRNMKRARSAEQRFSFKLEQAVHVKKSKAAVKETETKKLGRLEKVERAGERADQRRRIRLDTIRAKASIRNSMVDRRHVLAVSSKTMRDVIWKSVSNELTLKNMEEKAKRILLDRAVQSENSSVSSSLSSNTDRAQERAQIRSLLSQLPSHLFQ